MAGKPEQLVEARKKAVKSPNIGKRGKGKKTVALEKARGVWAKEQLGALPTIAKVQAKEAKNPKNFQERKYVIDQLLGKPAERVEVGGDDGGPIKIDVTIKTAIGKVYGKEEEEEDDELSTTSGDVDRTTGDI